MGALRVPALWVGAMAAVQRVSLVLGHDCLDLALGSCGFQRCGSLVVTQEVWPEAVAAT